jgi:hypothetical protein
MLKAKKDIKEKKLSKLFITAGLLKSTNTIKYKRNWFKKYRTRDSIKFNLQKNLLIRILRHRTIR